jgi:hypothetical protein
MCDGGGVHAFGLREKRKKACAFIACVAATAATIVAACMHLAREKKRYPNFLF